MKKKKSICKKKILKKKISHKEDSKSEYKNITDKKKRTDKQTSKQSSKETNTRRQRKKKRENWSTFLTVFFVSSKTNALSGSYQFNSIYPGLKLIAFCRPALPSSG